MRKLWSVVIVGLVLLNFTLSAITHGMGNQQSKNTARTARQKPSQTKTGVFTAYTSRPAETSGDPHLTADETDLREISSCVVANNSLDFGTKVEIEGIGVCTVRDRMAEKYANNHFDIYMGKNVKQAKQFGKRKLQYRILSNTNQKR